MPRFLRSDQQPQEPPQSDASEDNSPDLVARVNAYAAPMTPDPDSQLAPRDQLVKGITRPGHGVRPRRRARY